jgi:hypothetical protein
MGEQLCIVTSAQDVLEIYRNPGAFSIHEFIKHVVTCFGATPLTIDRMWHTTTPSPPHKPVEEMLHDMYKVQLHPGEKLDELQTLLLRRVDDALHWDKLATGPAVLSSSKSSSPTVEGKPATATAAAAAAAGPATAVEISLLQWCRHIMHDTTTRTLFGDALFNIDPQLRETFAAFDTNLWKLFYRFPRWAARDTYEARDKLVAALTRYFRLPLEQRPGAAWIVHVRERTFRSLGMDEEQIAVQLLIDYFV